MPPSDALLLVSGCTFRFEAGMKNPLLNRRARVVVVASILSVYLRELVRYQMPYAPSSFSDGRVAEYRRRDGVINICVVLFIAVGKDTGDTS